MYATPAIKRKFNTSNDYPEKIKQMQQMLKNALTDTVNCLDKSMQKTIWTTTQHRPSMPILILQDMSLLQFQQDTPDNQLYSTISKLEDLDMNIYWWGKEPFEQADSLYFRVQLNFKIAPPTGTSSGKAETDATYEMLRIALSGLSLEYDRFVKETRLPGGIAVNGKPVQETTHSRTQYNAYAIEPPYQYCLHRSTLAEFKRLPALPADTLGEIILRATLPFTFTIYYV